MTQTPFRIVVGLDFSDTSLRALEEALKQGAARRGCELHVAAVVDSDHAEMMPAGLRHATLTQIADETRDRLGRAVSDARIAFHAANKLSALAPVFTHVRVGAIADQLAALAAEIGADLLIVGTHGRRGIRRMMLGSVAEKTVRLAPCPVLVVRPRDLHAMDGLPQVEPACPACIATRERTSGGQWWCDAHTRDPDLVHIYSRSGRLDQPPSPAPYGSI
jgi:nucleotide-binding universal stress UspA family protein